MRLHGLNLIRQNEDRAYPHGQGIAIREALADGRMGDLPTLGITASIDLPNPIGASYFWAAFTAIDPDPYTATAFVAMANVLVAACAYSIAKKQAGPLAGLAAGILAATNPWSNWVARGAWLQGTIETFSALALWLAYTGAVSRSGRRIVAAGAVAAVAMQTYLVAFGLMAQLALAIFVSGAFRARQLKRPALITICLCVISLTMFAALFLARPKTPGNFGNPVNPPQPTDLVNLDPINHALRLASGRDFENTFVETDTPNFALRDSISDARATLIDVLFGVGLVILAWQSMRPFDKLRASRMLLVWAMAPVLGAFVIANFVFKAWEVHVFYLMLGSPVYYILPALIFSPLRRGEAKIKNNPLRLSVSAVGMLLVMGCAAISLWNFQGEVEANVRFPYNHDGLPSLLLRDQKRISGELKAGCSAISAKENDDWLASLLGTMKPVRAWALRAGNVSMSASLPAGGALCSFGVDEPAPAFAQSTNVAIAGQRRTDHVPLVVRVDKISQGAITQNQNMPTNLGWTLTHFAATPQAVPGEVITITHAWRVDSLPTEPHGNWYYAPFLKLVDSSGKTWASVDNAMALEGYTWKVGETLFSTAHLTIPPDAPAGEYTIITSLFDPNQKKNAVYFADGKVVLELNAKLKVESSK